MALEAPATRFSQGSAELVYLCYMAQSGPVASPPLAASCWRDARESPAQRELTLRWRH